jgi:glycerol-3-phosphate acyltransferase PlsY
MILILAAICGYLLGSIPFGLVLTKLAGAGDIREIGSGNIGATNVLRTGRKGLALATLVLDSGKGAAAVLLAQSMADGMTGMVAGMAVIIGHNFPVWLKFKGGKGVATSLGTLLAVVPPVGVLVFVTWLAVLATSRISSLSALTAAALCPVYAYWLADTHEQILFALATGLLVIVRHHANIRRLLAGTEPRVGGKKKDG